MRLRNFDFLSSSSLPEVLEILENHGERAKLIAGGTDLLVLMKQKMIAPEVLVNLLEIPELKRFGQTGDHLKLGSTTRLSSIETSPLLKNGWGILADAAHKIGSPQIRSLGTIGGNICNASPAADMAPVLLVLDAEVTLISNGGERTMSLESFFLGPGKTVLDHGEMLKEIMIPKPVPNSSGKYLKLGRRRSMDLSLVSVAVLLQREPESGLIRRARVALGSVFPTPLRARKAEKILEGRQLDEEAIHNAAECSQEECRPITDLRGSGDYRKEMVNILVKRALKDIKENIG